MKKARGGIHSIQFNLSLISIVFSIPVVVFLICTNIYSVKISREKEAGLLQNSLLVFQSQVDSDFLNYERYLMTIMGESGDLASLSRKDEDNARILAQFRIQNRLSELLSYNNRLFGLFVYSSESGKTAAAYDPCITMTEREALFEAVLELAQEEKSGVLWFPWRAKGQWYLFRVLMDRGVMAGAIVKPEALLADHRKGEQSFVDEVAYISPTLGPLTGSGLNIDSKHMAEAIDGCTYYQSDGKSYMATAVASAYGDFYLTAVTGCESIFSGLGGFQILLGVLTLICICMICGQRLFFKHKLIAPVNIAVEAMEQVQNGDLSTHIKAVRAFNEFQVVYKTFNAMIDEIRQLKIDIYEENLLRKQTTLQYLSLQMNPHFFVNSINVVSRLIESGNIHRAMKAMDGLTEYMRYALSCTTSVVSLESELGHVENYVELQNIRYCQEAALKSCVDPYTLFLAIPQMLIFTFIENSFKYARQKEQSLTLFLSCRLENGDAAELLVIEISDSGPGYPPEILEVFGNDRPIEDERGTHIGLYNVYNRLKLLYEGRAHMKLENRQGHAWAEIVLPAVDIEFWKEDKDVSSISC